MTLTTGSLLLLCPASAHAQGGMPLWTNLFKGPPHGGESQAAIAVDTGGNVFVTAPTSSSSYAVIAYSNSGVPLWTNFSAGFGIAVDRSGNVFVTGRAATVKYSSAGVPLWTNLFSGFYGNVVAVDGNGTVFVTGGTDLGSATISYSNVGVPLWTNRYAGALGGGLGGGIAVDSSGNVFVQGFIIFNSSSGLDYATVKYSNLGVPVWTNRYNGPANQMDQPTSLAVDSNGNVFVTGYSRNNDLQVGADYATVAYSNSGVPLWTNRYNGPANQGDEGLAIAVDHSGNVFVTGPSVTVRDFISDPADYATIKYSNSGVPLWTNRYDGPAGNNELATAIAVDSSGNVFVTGLSVNDNNFPFSSWDYATVAYSNAGELLWEQRYNSPDNLSSWPHAIAVDRAGNVFVTGYSRSSDGYSYYTTIKYSSSLPPPVNLNFQFLTNELVLSWTNAGFDLQSAPAVTGPFTNLPAATSPYTNVTTSAQQFFRLKSD